MTQKDREDNPFEDEIVADEWISSVENETAGIRDNELYPLLKDWAVRVQPKVIVDIGAGQGICADKLQLPGTTYIGVEPSTALVERANQKYSAANRSFVIGNAYDIPLADVYADAAFSVNVWFHLKDLATASQEMARVLKPGGCFLISTGNPAARHTWESFYVGAKKGDGYIDGKVNIPINPLTRNLMFFHTMDEMSKALEGAGLTVDSTKVFGTTTNHKDTGLFVHIEGHKSE